MICIVLGGVLRRSDVTLLES